MLETITAGWRTVRTTERLRQVADLGEGSGALARASAGGGGCGARAHAPTASSSPVGSAARGRLGLRVLARALEPLAGLRQEHVVQSGRVDLQVRDPDPGAVERANDLGQLLGAVVEAHGDGAGRRLPSRCRSG